MYSWILGRSAVLKSFVCSLICSYVSACFSEVMQPSQRGHRASCLKCLHHGVQCLRRRRLYAPAQVGLIFTFLILNRIACLYSFQRLLSGLKSDVSSVGSAALLKAVKSISVRGLWSGPQYEKSHLFTHTFCGLFTTTFTKTKSIMKRLILVSVKRKVHTVALYDLEECTITHTYT
jgi:hypothetical protein